MAPCDLGRLNEILGAACCENVLKRLLEDEMVMGSVLVVFEMLSACRSVLPKKVVAPIATPAVNAVRSLSTDFAESQTAQNLRDAFAGESMANRRYLYFAQKADIEGHNDVSALFRSTAEGETGHAFGHLEWLEEVGDPATNEPIGDTVDNLKSAIIGETHEYTDMYPGMARTARDEGFDEVAEWFDTLARAEKSHAGRFEKALAELDA